jgi:hypothetical protein
MLALGATAHRSVVRHRRRLNQSNVLIGKSLTQRLEQTSSNNVRRLHSRWHSLLPSSEPRCTAGQTPSEPLPKSLPQSLDGGALTVEQTSYVGISAWGNCTLWHVRSGVRTKEALYSLTLEEFKANRPV